MTRPGATPDTSPPRRALVLAGGGARGAFQVGMLDQLVNGSDLDFQILRGVSVGALNAASLARPVPKALSAAIEDLREATRQVRKRAVKLFVLAPREWYGNQPNDDERDNSAVNFSPAAISRAVEHGRKVAADPSLWIRT